MAKKKQPEHDLRIYQTIFSLKKSLRWICIQKKQQKNQWNKKKYERIIEHDSIFMVFVIACCYGYA